MVRRCALAVALLGLALQSSCIKEPVDPGTLGPPEFSHITLVSPSETEAPWERESEHVVLWQAGGLERPLTAQGVVSTSLDGGATWDALPLPQIDLAARRALVRVPPTGGAQLRIRVRIGKYAADSVPITLSPSRKKRYGFVRIGTDLPFGPRDGMGGLVYNGRMYGIGGWNPLLYAASTRNDVWSSKDGTTWLMEKPNTFVSSATFDTSADWSARHWAGYAVHAGKMFIVGGDPINGLQQDVWSSTTGGTWQNVTQLSNYPARVLHATYVFDDRLWVVGGQTLHATDNPTVYQDLWSSKDGVAWARTETVGPMWGARGMMGGNAVFKGRMWVVCGGIYEQEVVRPERVEYDDVWSTADGAHWDRELQHTPFRSRYYHNVAVFDDRLWVLGGYGAGYQLGASGNLADAYYTSDGRNWYSVDVDPGFVGRHGATAWAHDGALYWGSGNAFDVSNKWLADMWKITPLP